MTGSRVEELRRRLERDPASRLFAQLAEEHRKAGDHGEAIRVARAGLAQHPVYPSARLTLGRALLESGDPAGARAELEEALRQAPDNILASRFLGQTLEALGDRAGAVRQYHATLRMAPADQELAAHLQKLSLPPVPAQPPPLPRAAAERARATDEVTHPLPAGVPDPPAEQQLAATVRLPPRGAAGTPEPPAAPEAVSPQPATPPAPPPPPQAAPAAPAPSSAAPFSSSTLAELYLRQGLAAQAAEVYGRVLAEDPTNERARRRLGEIQAGLAAAPAADVDAPPAAASDPVQARRREIERTIAGLEALLGAIRRRQ